MTSIQLMRAANALRTIKLLSEVCAEQVICNDDLAEHDSVAMAADMDAISAAAATAGIAIAEAYPEFPAIMQRAERASEARARMMLQKETDQ